MKVWDHFRHYLMQVKLESKEVNFYSQNSLLRTISFCLRTERMNIWGISQYDWHPSCSRWDFEVLFETRFCCGMDSESAAYFGDHSANREHKLRTKQQIASSNLKYIPIFKRIYFKWISFISVSLVKKREQSKSPEILSNKLSLSTSNSNFVNLKYRCDCHCSRTVTRCTRDDTALYHSQFVPTLTIKGRWCYFC